jgi:DNA-binding Lrp family transcriptional regulator
MWRLPTEVIACHLVSGEADYFLEVVVPDLKHYQRFLVGKLLNLRGQEQHRHSDRQGGSTASPGTRNPMGLRAPPDALVP